MQNRSMSPSDLDTKATSVPPNTFTIGDRVWVHRPTKCSVQGVISSLPIDHTGRFLVVLKEEGFGEWYHRDEFSPDTSPAQGAKDFFKSADTVNHPSHYTAGTLETIDAIEALVGQAGWSPATGYRLGNVLKYIWRHAHKGGLESLKKARWYLDREIAACEKAVKP